ncbi:UPF0182 family protein [Candidatus Harpocratesius sp.]
MAPKKSCERHYRYVASCPDCRALNEGNNKDQSKRLYEDAKLGDTGSLYSKEDRNKKKIEPEIPHISDEIPTPPKSNRYRYHHPPNPDFKRRVAIIGIIIFIALIIGIFYGYPLWHAKISLQNQLYSLKSDINYWRIYTLDYWSTRFFFNKIGLIGGVLGALIMSIPPEDSILKLLSLKFGWDNLKKWKSLVLWWTIGFVFFYIIGQSIEKGYFALTMELTQQNYLKPGSGEYFNALKALSDPSKVSEIDIFYYQAITHPIVMYVLGVIIFRLILRIIYYFVMDRNEIKITTLFSFLICIFFIIALFNRPLKAQDGISLIRVWGIYLGIFVFFSIGVALFIYGKKAYGYHIDFNDLRFKRKMAVISLSIMVILLIPIFVSIPTTIKLGNPEVWDEIEWNVRYSQQIEWTRTAAGISYGNNDFFQIMNIDDYTSNVNSSDSEILNVIRQFDKEYSGKIMARDIKNNYETMADSDIIYIPGNGEYWVAPKTLLLDKLLEDVKYEHTEIYDHVEGFLALDTSTGKMVTSSEYLDDFGVISNYPIFFGEREDTSYSSQNQNNLIALSDYYAYDNDILLNTGWSRTTNSTSVYEGLPDGELQGLEAFWYIMSMGTGLSTFALNSSFKKEFLINRNVMNRVGSVLMPGMILDNDPYLIFNRENNTLYYGVSIYTEIKLSSYFYSPIYRFLGTVLVDVKTGELTWYKNPAGFEMINNDPLQNIWKIYWDNDFYPWKNPSDEEWLISQLRYPETLWEKQLNVDYYYHVEDPRTWNSQSDFFKLPEGSDVFYIETDLGEGLEFVGVQLVEYNRADALKLTGLYVIRHGKHFGETFFFRAQDLDNLIGPNTAKDELKTQATQEISLIANERFGNILLYPLAGSLYYYIPIYSQTGDYESFVGTGLVNAFTKQTYYGDTLTDAYNKLALDLFLNTTTPEETIEDLQLTVNADDQIEYSPANWAEFEVLVKYFNTNDSLPQRNVTLNMSLRADIPMNVKLFNQNLVGVEYNFSSNLIAYNYTIATWDGLNGLYPGQGHSMVIKMNPVNAISSGIIIYYSFELFDLDTGEKISTGWKTFTFLNSNI